MARAARLKVVEAPKYREVILHLPIEATDAAEAILKERGTNLEEYFSLALLNVRPAGRTVGLDDAMPQGKYLGVSIETCIRNDPEYMRWFAENVRRYQLDRDAAELLVEMLT